MPYSRVIEPAALPVGKLLTADLVGIGMKFTGPAHDQPNIEDTLLAASDEGMERDDLRVLAVMTTWLGVHGSRVNADRMVRLVDRQSSPRVRAYWSAVGHWLDSDRRFARLKRLHVGPRIDLLRVGSDFHVRRSGEDPRFEGSALRVPAGILRDRSEDVLTPSELARRHTAYRYRVLIGPTYRADMWAALDHDPDMSTAELARLTYGSFATAWNVKRDWAVQERADSEGVSARQPRPK